MKQILFLNPEKVTEKEVKNYFLREAARAIVMDDEGKIALLHAVKHNYYKLPGGGIEADEDQVKGLKRECREEIGSDIEIIGQIGKTLEYWRLTNTKQISYCYLAKLKGKKEASDFTKGEIEDGFEAVWFTYEDARRTMAETFPTNLEGRAYIVPRDTAFLEQASLKIKKLL